jgi:hypothetical protein
LCEASIVGRDALVACVANIVPRNWFEGLRATRNCRSQVLGLAIARDRADIPIIAGVANVVICNNASGAFLEGVR